MMSNLFDKLVRLKYSRKVGKIVGYGQSWEGDKLIYTFIIRWSDRWDDISEHLEDKVHILNDDEIMVELL